jgi:S1-C subfamily serine protease
MNKLAIILLSMLLFLQYFVSVLPKNPVKEISGVSVTIKYAGGTGSGVIQKIGNDVYVWTANHVLTSPIPFPWPVEVVYDVHHKGRHTAIQYFRAEIFARSEEYDLAILKLKHNHYFRYGAELYKDDEIPEVGQDIWGVFAPLGEENSQTVVRGTISQTDRLFKGRSIDQIDCSINRGCSGGGVFLNDGRLIGIAVMMRDNNIGLMVPVRVMREWAKTTDLPKELYQ